MVFAATAAVTATVLGSKLGIGAVGIGLSTAARYGCDYLPTNMICDTVTSAVDGLYQTVGSAGQFVGQTAAGADTLSKAFEIVSQQAVEGAGVLENYNAGQVVAYIALMYIGYQAVHYAGNIIKDVAQTYTEVKRAQVVAAEAKQLSQPHNPLQKLFAGFTAEQLAALTPDQMIVMANLVNTTQSTAAAA